MHGSRAHGSRRCALKSRRTFHLAAVLAILLLPQHPLHADVPPGTSVPVVNGSVAVPALGYAFYTVRVDRSAMNNAMIVGHVEATGGTGNDIEVLVGTESDFTNWENGHAASPIYDSGKVTAADVRASLPESGTYVVVFSNAFSTFTPKTVTGSLRLAWMPPILSLAPGGGMNAAARGLFLVLIIISSTLLVFAVWRAASRANGTAATSEKKAA
jgi:hypothetical protein